jgi:hypothetical protein
MNLGRFGRHALGVCTTMVLLAGCGGSQGQVGANGAMPHTVAPAQDLAYGQSWMAPDATERNLLYISDERTNEVLAYSFMPPARPKLVGKLAGVSGLGLCVDKTGDLFIPTGIGSKGEVLEYAHGGTKRIKTLTGVDTPQDCSVDPTTGNLAVVDPFGAVAIFAKAQGNPKFSYYNAPNFHPDALNCAYDNKGDLFVDAELYPNQHSGVVELAVGELVKGGSNLGTVWLPEGSQKHQGFPGGIQWDGKHIAVGDSISGVVYVRGIRHFSLDGSNGALQFWLQGKILIAPNSNAHTVMFWEYPVGGPPSKTLHNLQYPYGAAVSLAQ